MSTATWLKMCPADKIEGQKHYLAEAKANSFTMHILQKSPLSRTQLIQYRRTSLSALSACVEVETKAMWK